MAFEIKRNDRRPRWRVSLKSNGSPVNLTSAVSAVFTMKSGSTTKINKAEMTFVDRSLGVVEYAWLSGDTSASGDYNAEVEVDWGGGETQSFPSSGFFTIKINDDLA